MLEEDHVDANITEENTKKALTIAEVPIVEVNFAGDRDRLYRKDGK